MSDLEGSTLGHYRIVEQIGAGGMGEVYRARDESLERDVAIKVLPEAVAQDPVRLERFRREARAVARLEHPNILAIYDFGTEGGVTYAVTELLEGQTLRKRIPTSGLPWQKVVEMGAAMADGLAAAHGKKIVHRDLKPENVFVTSDGRIKILDFGLATLREEVSPEAETGTLTPAGTQPGTVIGTLGYMSPEQLKGAGADARSDIFALGCVLYEMVSGRRAFAGTTSAEMIAAILKEEPQQLSSAGATIPADLESTIHRCLEKSPAARFQSAADLAFALRSVGTGPAVAMAVPGVEAVHARRRRLAVAAAAVVAVFVGAAGIYFGTRKSETAPGIGASGRPAVVVMPFETHMDGETMTWLATGLPSMLVTGLAQTRGLDVVSPERVMEVFKQLGSEDVITINRSLVPEVARRTGAGAVVVGNIYASGTRLRIDLQVQDVASGRLLTAQSVQGDDVFPLADELAHRIRESLGLSDGAGGLDIADVMTSSLEAYRLYWQGHEAFAQTRYEDAARLLEAAVAVDPTCAMAYLELWLMHSGYATTTNPSASKYRAQMLANLDRLTDRQRLIVQALVIRADGDPAAAIAVLERLIDEYPDEEWGYELLAAIRYYSLGQRHQARAMWKRQVDAFPASSSARTGYGYALLSEGRFEDALRQFEAYAELSPREPNPVDCLGDYHLATGEIEEAMRQFELAVRMDPSFGAQSGLAWAYAMAGRYGDALDTADALFDTPTFSTPCFFSAFLLSRVGRYREAEQKIQEGERFWNTHEDMAKQVSLLGLRTIIAFERSGVTRGLETSDRLIQASERLQGREIKGWYTQLSHLFAGLVALRAGDLDVADHHLKRLDSLVSELHNEWNLRWLDMLRAEIFLAAGDLDSAESAFRPREPGQKMLFNRGFLDFTVFLNNLPFRDGLARVAVARGDLEGAVTAYRYLLTPGRSHEFTTVLEPRYVLELARLLDRKGDHAAARQEYGHFLDLWENADPDLPELEEARTRLAHLSAQ